MSRRSANVNLEFGSDSFLDIVANIVGILIILIVIAGVRVSNTPVLLNIDEPLPEADSASNRLSDQLGTPEQAKSNDVALTVGTGRTESEISSQTPAAIPSVGPSQELIRIVHDLDAELLTFDEAEATTAAKLQQAIAAEAAANKRLADRTKTLESAGGRFELSRQRVRALGRLLNDSKAKLDEGKSALQSAEREKVPIEKIEHKLTPVSKVVNGSEIHLRLTAKQVAVIPLDQLIKRLKSQIERQKDWLLKFRRHQGHVGPVGGFTMTYVVERKALSVIDELRYGRGVMRIGVSQWQIQPEPDLITETEDEALSPGSEFYRALLSAEPDTTLTFWVYPDSFKMYRRLQKVAQDEGFTVAARPMPFGVPIAGSPNGTRSAGQ